MELNYQINTDLVKFKVINDTCLKDLNFYKKIIYNLSYLISKLNSFSIEVISENALNLNLLIKYANKENMRVLISSSKIILIYKNIKYTFTYNYITNGFTSSLIEIHYLDKLLIEKFINHAVTIIKQVNTHIYELIIPIDINSTLDIDMFNFFNKERYMSDLEYFYKTYFLSWQKHELYNLNNSTILRIYNMLNNTPYLEEEMRLINGEGYYRVLNKTINDIKISVILKEKEEPIITIIGFNNTSNIKLDKEIRELLNKLNNSFTPRLSLIK